MKRQAIEEDDDGNTRAYKERMNYLCLDRHPYFFIYRYADTRKKYRKHIKDYQNWCKNTFKMSLEELLNLDSKNAQQIDFLKGFFKYMPVIDSDSAMNRLCHYIENINMNVRSHLKVKEGEDMRNVFVPSDIEWNDSRYSDVVDAYMKYCDRCKLVNPIEEDGFNEDIYGDSPPPLSMLIGMLYSYISDVCSNPYEAVMYLSYYMYVERDSSNKEMLWQTYGQEIESLIRSRNNGKVLFPMLDDDGDIKYLGKRYSMREVSIDY